MKFNEVLKKARKCDTTGLPQKRVAVLGHYATQYFCKCLIANSKIDGLDIDLYEAEFNQINFETFNPDSDLYSHDPEYVIILFDTKLIAQEFNKKSNLDKKNYAEDFVDNLTQNIAAISEKTNAKIITFNLTELKSDIFNFLAYKSPESITYQVQKINYKLTELTQDRDNFYVLDMKDMASQVGYSNVYDQPIFINSNQPYHIDFIPKLTSEITRLINTFQGKIHKCLILDLDNTLWGGVIGDDGINNIQVGDLGQGKIFTEIQLWAKNLKERGVILCVCSKNNEETAKEPFEKLKSMSLDLSDIAVFVANWNNKADNIKYIQQVLNIGFDSMVFLDDNPAEREIVKTNIPEITVPDLPDSPEDYMNYISSLNLFSTVSYSSLDKNRTEQYKAEAKRVKLQSTTNIEEYLQSLDMAGEVTPINSENISRIAQLTQRSNQFNLRTIRYSESELEKWNVIESNNGFSISLQDKFGDYGIISVVMTERHNGLENEIFITNWLMSCRVLKRNVEHFVINQIVEHFKSQGIQKIYGEFIPTSKNKMVKLHYQNIGFQSAEEENLWVLETANFNSELNYIKLSHES